jgi:hypothetical protein
LKIPTIQAWKSEKAGLVLLLARIVLFPNTHDQSAQLGAFNGDRIDVPTRKAPAVGTSIRVSIKTAAVECIYKPAKSRLHDHLPAHLGGERKSPRGWILIGAYHII